MGFEQGDDWGNKTVAALLSKDETDQMGRGQRSDVGCTSPDTALERHFQGESSGGQNSGPGKERVDRGGEWIVSLYSNGVSSSKTAVSREWPRVRDERVVGLDSQGSPSQELRQDNEKE